MEFLRNLDSGMRRLGFLQILITKCMKEGEFFSDRELGDNLWEWARKNQDSMLMELGAKRGLKKSEVGRISEKIASRYVKYATEVGFLTKGSEKQLTDSGRLFQIYNTKDFFLEDNPGQKILLLFKILEKDNFMMTELINAIVKFKTMTRTEAFNWFADDIIPRIISQAHDDKKFVERLNKIIVKFRNVKTKKQSYDSIKHIIETRIENLVDLGICDKRNKKYVANSFTTILSKSLRPEEDDGVFKAIAIHYNVVKNMPKELLTKTYIEQYERLTRLPVDSAYLPTLHFCIFVDGIIRTKTFVDNTTIKEFEDAIFKSQYGKVVFLRDREGKITHVNIDPAAKKILLGKTR